MKTTVPEPADGVDSPQSFEKELWTLTSRILRYASRGFVRSDFLRHISKELLHFFRCDIVEIYLKERGRCFRSQYRRGSELFRITAREAVTEEGADRDGAGCFAELEEPCWAIADGQLGLAQLLARWSGDVGRSLAFQYQVNREGESICRINCEECGHSLALVPFGVDPAASGLLMLQRTQSPVPVEVEVYEHVAHVLGLAVSDRQAQLHMRERLKELACLYRINQLAHDHCKSLHQVLEEVVKLVPSALLYSESAVARIILDARSHVSNGFRETEQSLVADIVVMGQQRGVVEIHYIDEKPPQDEGPFLKEERELIDAVAREMALIIEGREAVRHRLNLEKQLRHADRLATIGQLAAGVAHELNEPLGAILGFAQLTLKGKKLPEQAKQDLQKIVDASLNAREIIRKLLVFARQQPPTKRQVDLNELVREGLRFLGPRCVEAGIRVACSLEKDLPRLTADRTQLYQVLVNLVVNAIQAMPEGGALTVETSTTHDWVSLVVADTGIGMSPKVMKRIFLPFYTTKGIGQGTGLGLAVAHGIVTSHDGSIQVESEVGRGSRFEVRIPVELPSRVQGAESQDER